jgi:hypothetical protein
MILNVFEKNMKNPTSKLHHDFQSYIFKELVEDNHIVKYATL